MIAAVGKPVLSISGATPVHGRTNGLVQSYTGARLGRAQPGFELAPAVFDGAKIGRVRGQKQHPRSARRAAFAPASYFVDAQVIEYDRVAGPQGRTEHWVEAGGKAVLIEGSVQRHDGLQTIDRQGSHHRPVGADMQGHALAYAPAAYRPAVAAGVGQVHARLVHKFEAREIFALDGFQKGPAQGFYPLGVALGGVDTLFFRRKSCAASPCQINVRRTAGPPPVSSAARSSASMLSGRWPTQATNCACAAASSLGAGPPVWGRAATQPVVRGRHKSLSTKAVLTLNAAATWAMVRPGWAQALATRSRRS